MFPSFSIILHHNPQLFHAIVDAYGIDNIPLSLKHFINHPEILLKYIGISKGHNYKYAFIKDTYVFDYHHMIQEQDYEIFYSLNTLDEIIQASKYTKIDIEDFEKKWYYHVGKYININIYEFYNCETLHHLKLETIILKYIYYYMFADDYISEFIIYYYLRDDPNLKYITADNVDLYIKTMMDKVNSKVDFNIHVIKNKLISRFKNIYYEGGIHVI